MIAMKKKNQKIEFKKKKKTHVITAFKFQRIETIYVREKKGNAFWIDWYREP